jgi:hypothetical protein
MTVGTQTPRVEYTEDGSATVFSTPYAFFDEPDLIVTRFTGAQTHDSDAHTLILNVDYTVAGGYTPETGPQVGSITLLTASIAGAKLRIDRWTKRSQELHYEPGDDFPARSHENGLDRAEMQIQELTRDQLSLEQIVDYLALYVLKAGVGIRIDYDDDANTITITNTGLEGILGDLPDMLELSGDQQTFDGGTGSPGAGGLTSEDVQDIVGAMFRDGSGISHVYNDGAGTLTITNTGGGGGGFTLPDVLASIAAAGVGANEMLVGTGDQAMAAITISPFMQGVMSAANAATALADFGGVGVAAQSLGSPGFIKFTNGFIIQWGHTSVIGNASPTISYPTAFAAYSIPVGSGRENTNDNPNNCGVLTAGLGSFTVINNSPDTVNFFWIAIGV